MEHVTVVPTDQAPPCPKLVVASIKVQVVLNTMHKKNEVVALACVIHDSGIARGLFFLYIIYLCVCCTEPKMDNLWCPMARAILIGVAVSATSCRMADGRGK
jgi:hypothetical protein